MRRRGVVACAVAAALAASAGLAGAAHATAAPGGPAFTGSALGGPAPGGPAFTGSALGGPAHAGSALVATRTGGTARAGPLPGGAALAVVAVSAAQGGLAISAPVPTPPATSRTLPDVPTGAASTSGPLGTVRVTDTRTFGGGTWTATVSSTDFVAGTAASQIIDNVNIVYNAGPVTRVSGSCVLLPALPGNLDAARVAVTCAAGTPTTATWNPTLTVTVGNSRPSGVYTATVTHSVA